jgi:hypothetical protein
MMSAHFIPQTIKDTKNKGGKSHSRAIHYKRDLENSIEAWRGKPGKEDFRGALASWENT